MCQLLCELLAGVTPIHEHGVMVSGGREAKRQGGKEGAGSLSVSLPLSYALKLEPQPQVLVALGLLNTNPRPMISSLKSITVPFRYR